MSFFLLVYVPVSRLSSLYFVLHFSYHGLFVHSNDRHRSFVSSIFLSGDGSDGAVRCVVAVQSTSSLVVLPFQCVWNKNGSSLLVASLCPYLVVVH